MASPIHRFDTAADIFGTMVWTTAPEALRAVIRRVIRNRGSEALLMLRCELRKSAAGSADFSERPHRTTILPTHRGDITPLKEQAKTLPRTEKTLPLRAKMEGVGLSALAT